MGNLNLSTVNISVARAKTMRKLPEIATDIGVSNHVNGIVCGWQKYQQIAIFRSTTKSNAWPTYLSCDVDLKADFLEMIPWRLCVLQDITVGNQYNRKCCFGQFHLSGECQ